MKPKKLLFAAVLTLAAIVQSFNSAQACTGEWVGVYQGGSSIHHYYCESTWFTNDCVCGDTKAAG